MIVPDPVFLATAVEIVLRAGDIQMAGRESGFRVSKKGEIDLVTLNLYRQLGSSVVGLLMFVATLRSTRVGHILLSALFVWAAGTNLRIALTSPADYLTFAQFAVLDVYRTFILGYFAQHTAALAARPGCAYVAVP